MRRAGSSASQDVVLVGANIDRLIALSLVLGARAYEVTIVRSDEPLADALNYPGSPAAMVLSLAGQENVADIRALLSARSTTRLLLLTPHRPPSAALARIVRAHGDVILPVDEPDVVVVATLIAGQRQTRKYECAPCMMPASPGPTRS